MYVQKYGPWPLADGIIMMKAPTKVQSGGCCECCAAAVAPTPPLLACT
jgi:hypothetical protein